ncbi:hypothetical protein M1295_00915 [Patescibacteria group bacterium]|nr:hypothetical protein [Patescibacteria group bacterium]
MNEDIESVIEENPESEKTEAIYLKVLDDMETAQEKMRRFRIFGSDS